MAAANSLDTSSRLPCVAGKVNDAVSASSQVHMSEAPRLMPKKDRRQVWTRHADQDRTNGTRLRKLALSPVGRIAVGSNNRRSASRTKLGSTSVELPLCPQKFTTVLVRVCDKKMVRKKEKCGTQVEHSAQRNRSGGTIPSAESSIFGLKSITMVHKQKQTSSDESPPPK